MTDYDGRIRELVAHAYENAPAIKNLMDNAGVKPGDIQAAADLIKIPVTSKDDLVKIHAENPPFGGFLAIDPNTLPRIYISPGPIFDPQPINPDAGDKALTPFKSVGFGHDDRVLNTFSYHLTPAGLLLDEGLRACGSTVLPMGPGNTDLQINMMMKLNATGFVGQPSYLMTILDKINEMGIPKEHVPIKKALFTAEPYTLIQRGRFEGEYGMKTTSAYATADLGLVAYTQDGLEGFCVIDLFYLEIVDPKTGEPTPQGDVGEIVVTSFNKAYPLIRFGTGDLGALAVQPACDGGQQLTGLFGRSGGAVKVRGMFLHPNQLMAAKTYFPMIKHIQAIVTRPENNDHVLIRLELNESGADDGLAEQIQQLAEAALRLRIDKVEIVASGVIDPEDRVVRDDRDWE